MLTFETLTLLDSQLKLLSKVFKFNREFMARDVYLMSQCIDKFKDIGVGMMTKSVSVDKEDV